MPQQTIFDLCVNLNDENDNSEKFGLHDLNPPETCRAQKMSKKEEKLVAILHSASFAEEQSIYN